MAGIEARFSDTNTAVQIAKECCGIDRHNALMSDEEVQEVCIWFASGAPDTMLDNNGDPIFGRIGIGIMLFIALTEFPEFYDKYELAAIN